MKNFERKKSHLGGNNIVCFLYPQEKVFWSKNRLRKMKNSCKTDTTQVSTHHINIFSKKKNWKIIIVSVSTNILSYYFILFIENERNSNNNNKRKKLQASVVTVIFSSHSFCSRIFVKFTSLRKCVFGFSLQSKSPLEASLDFTILPFRINVDDTKKTRWTFSLFLFSNNPSM